VPALYLGIAQGGGLREHRVQRPADTTPPALKPQVNRANEGAAGTNRGQAEIRTLLCECPKVGRQGLEP
jgi:hypothetical protein